MFRMTTDFAILAPVHLIHLQSAKQEGLTDVAFGLSSSIQKRLVEADDLRGDAAVRVLVYASHDSAKSDRPCVSWTGYYVGANATEDQRPATTKDASGDDKEGWSFLWVASCLRELKEPVPIGKLGGRGKDDCYDEGFKPRSLMLIRYPGDIAQFAVPGMD
jgi:hypothetical protein